MPRRGLDTGTALTVYRIVQEALTNVVRHAGADTRCEVEVDVDEDGGVRVEVVDDGHVRAEQRPGGGFAVSARLPGRRGAAAPVPSSDKERA